MRKQTNNFLKVSNFFRVHCLDFKVYILNIIKLSLKSFFQVFARGESYTIKMETVLPESPINKELGAVTSHVQNY